MSVILLIGCTNYSSAPSLGPAISASNSAEPAQIVEGFADYEFPAPDVASSGVTATGQVAAESAQPALGRVSQNALGNVGGAAAEVVSDVPVVSGLVQNAGDAGSATGGSGAFRPIPTVTAEEAVNGVALATQQLAQGSMQPLVTVDRPLFIEHMRSYRDGLREMVYLADMAFASGSLDCNSVQVHMATLDGTPKQFSAPLDLQLANYHLQLAFEQTEAAFRPIANYCAGMNGAIALHTIQPDTTVTNIFPMAQYALQNVYDAVLWVTGDSEKVHNLYMTTRGKIYAYGALAADVNSSCQALNAAYEAIVYSPQLSLPEGQVANTYQHYVAAINGVAAGGSSLYQTCNNGAGTPADARALVAPSIADGLIQIDIAITYLP